MVSLTKKKRYSTDVVKALMENYHELESTLTEGNPSHMEPMFDYAVAVDNVDFTDMERKVFLERFPMDDVCPSPGTVAASVGLSRRYVDFISEVLADKIETEMNRGVFDE